jgi:hypothetical protein
MVGTKKGEKQGHVWVMDFGIAKMAEGGMDTDELPGLGTVRYMSPEQARAILRPSKSGPRVKPDHRVDIYAFGVMFYEALTGRHPALNDGAGPLSFDETLAAILEAEPVPPHELVDDCPLATWEVISSCIALDPDARYASFDPVVTELRALGREALSRQQYLSKEHRLSRHMAEQVADEEARSARQAAFEAVIKGAPSEEVMGAGDAAVRVGKTSATVGGGSGSEALATLPVGRGRGHTVKIPKGALPAPSALPETTQETAALPVNAVTETPSAKTKTLEPPETGRMTVVMLLMMGFVTVLSVTAMAVSVSVWRERSPDTPILTGSATIVPVAAPVRSVSVSTGASAAAAAAPAASEPPVLAASGNVGASASPAESSPPGAGAGPSSAITAEPSKAVKPKRAPAPARPNKPSEPAFLLDLEDKPAPKGRR